MDPKELAVQNVLAYLQRNKVRLQTLPVDLIVWEVEQFVTQAASLPDNELRAHVAIWRSLNGPLYPLPLSSPPTIADSKLIQSVKRAVTTVIEGVDVKHGMGTVNIGVTGLTAELNKGDSRASIGVSWSGTLAVETQKGKFHFAGELSSERWELKLSFPDDTVIPDLSRVGKIFSEGEKGMREVLRATSTFRNLNDVARIKEAVKPHMRPIEEAVDAAKAIAKAPAKGGVNVGVSIGSPDPLPGQTGMPSGVQAQVTLTLRF